MRSVSVPQADVLDRGRQTLGLVALAVRRNLCRIFLQTRFTPKSGHVQCNLVCPLWAKSGHRGEPGQAPLLDAEKADALLLPKTDRLNCENNLAGRSGLKDLLVCSRGLGEWQYLADNGPQSAVLEACKESGVDVCLFRRCDSPEGEGTN